MSMSRRAFVLGAPLLLAACAPQEGAGPVGRGPKPRNSSSRRRNPGRVPRQGNSFATLSRYARRRSTRQKFRAPQGYGSQAIDPRHVHPRHLRA